MSRAPHTRLVTDLVFPVRNCADTLGETIAAVPSRLVRSIVVVDRDSQDASAQVARGAGAVVLRQSVDGYGAAARRAVSHLEALPHPPDVVAFCAGDGSDDPTELERLLAPIDTDNAELVVGVRGGKGRGRPVGTRVALGLIGAIYRYRFEDLGPFRAIRMPALVAMGLTDNGDGFGAEMQVKALNLGLSIVEVPVRYRQSEGRAKLSTAAKKASRTLLQIVKHSTAR